MHFILIGNYPPDNQPSMRLFAEMMQSNLQRLGHQAEIWVPEAVFGRGFKSTNAGLGKWMGYIDKYLLFPVSLKWRIATKGLNKLNVRFHVCDHSNAMYMPYLPNDKSAITCHDVIAIRSGLGYTDSNQKASLFGRLQQRWILGSLKHSKFIACVSEFTLNQLEDLVKGDSGVDQRCWKTILNPFNADFKSLGKREIGMILKEAGVNDGTKYIMHVGSNLQRKNRKMLVSMVHELGTKWSGNILFAGEEPDAEVLALAAKLGLTNRIVKVVKPSHNTLNALYSGCEAFVFPSYNEGFGWPLIEAQACGAPVISSNLQPMPEVSGGAALYANPDDARAFADALLSLQDVQMREKLIADGFANCKRFEIDYIMKQYLALHGVPVSQN